MNSPSPLVPQGAIPPRTMSRSARVLVVGFTVVAVHVVGLGLFLLQGCKKDVTLAEGGATNSANAPLSFPTIDTNVYYTNAAALPSPATGTGAVSTAPGAMPPVTTNFALTPSAPTPGIGADSAFPSLPADTTGGMAPAPASPEKEYKIAKGDTLSALALRNGVSITALQQANPGLDPRKLRIGQTIKIPAGKPATAAMAGMGANDAGVSAAGGAYKVKAGDTLTRIASKHGITINELRAANNLRTTRLLIGQTLQIPQPAPRATASERNGSQPQ